MKKILAISVLILVAVLITYATGVGPGPALSESGSYIIEAPKAKELLRGDNVALVDMREAEVYGEGHIEGAVNITRNEIVVNSPYPNLLCPGDQIAAVLGQKGIANDTLVLIYDDSNNMDAARLWWTLKVYGHPDAKVISGGFNALVEENLPLSTSAPTVTAKQYDLPEADLSYMATIDDIIAQVENPQPNVVLLDTRTRDEFNSGNIPGSVLVDYQNNVFDDGRFKSVQHIRLLYKEKGLTADKELIIYCAVSVRGAQTFLSLYNAGYRNLKLYDAAWVEYSDLFKTDTGDGTAAEPSPDEPEAPGG